MKNILFTSNKVHTTARIGVLFFSLCFSPLINAGNAEKPMNGIESSETTQQNKIKITGVVTDSKGESIIGANVVVKGQSNVGAITDVEGRYQIMIPSDNAILQVSYLGYVTEEIKVKGRRNINVMLNEDSKALDEVVVVGYGQQKKESVVVSMSSIKPKDIVVPSRSLNNSLAGQVAGLIAVQRSGEPGYDNAEFWIRGVSTFAGGTSPLVLVDGVPRSMSDIEPDEIETFSVLKDAAATAIYGAEGANGVVLVTTKRGRVEKAKISFKTEHTISSPTRLPEFVGSADYLDLFNEALHNDGELPQFSDDLIAHYRNNDDPDLYPNTNWIDKMLRKNTFTHRYTLNVRGGTEKAKYFVSAAYYNESGIFKGSPTKQYNTNIGIDRINLRSNIDMNVSSTTTVGVDLALQYLVNNYPGTGTANIFRSMLITPPYTFPAVYSDGTVSTYSQERDANMRNPYNLLMNSGYAKEYRTAIQSKVYVDQKLDFITKGLSVRLNASYDYDSEMIVRREYNPTRYHATGRDENGNLLFATVVSGNPELQDPKNSATSATKKIYIDAAINYKRTFDQHEVGAMLLYMQKETQYHNVALPYRKQGLVGRLTYGYGGRYFIEGNFGYTGSENFQPGRQYGFFPSVALGWVPTGYKFIQEALPWLDYLKIRASYGSVGNDRITDVRFPYLTKVNEGTGSAWGVPDIEIIGETRIGADNLAWEKAIKSNVGIEGKLFNNKIDFVVDIFHDQRNGIFQQRVQVPEFVGVVSNPYANVGKMKSYGADGNISFTQDFTPDFGFTLRGNFTYSKNKVQNWEQAYLEYPYLEYNNFPYNSIRGYQAVGLFKDEDDIKYSPKQTFGEVMPGDIKYKDINGDGMVDKLDMVPLTHSTYPLLMYGLGAEIRYKNLTLGVLFKGTGKTSFFYVGQKTTVNDETRLNGMGYMPFFEGNTGNVLTLAANPVNRWIPRDYAIAHGIDPSLAENKDARFPRLQYGNNSNNSQLSTFWQGDSRYIRLQEITLSYHLAAAFLRRIGVSSLDIQFVGNNLYVWDKVKLFDPEQARWNGRVYPIPSTYSLQLYVNL